MISRLGVLGDFVHDESKVEPNRDRIEGEDKRKKNGFAPHGKLTQFSVLSTIGLCSF